MNQIVREALERYSPVAVVGMFSGGNDSTVMIDAVKDDLDFICHINTGIGIEQTRDFVRSMARDYWHIPLIEEQTTHHYEDIVLTHGFPGPAGHGLMYRRLKERPLREVRRRFVRQRGERVAFLTGVRRHESARRMNAGYEPANRQGSIVWVNPLWDWTDDGLLRYRREHPDLPRNPVGDLLHMSGECLCGAFAHPGELDEIGLWFPEVAERIRRLEHRVEQAGLPCRWGMRPPPRQVEGQSALLDVGPLYSACALREELGVE